MEIIRELWLCVDCTIVACNGDYSGIEDDARIAKINAGFEALGAHVSANFDLESDDDNKRGHREFSSCGCDCCGSRLAGAFHRFAILGEPEAPKPPIDLFVAEYTRQLTRVLTADAMKPAGEREYAYDLRALPGVVEKMRAAFVRGSFNKDGKAIRATCKALGIPYTYAGIKNYLKVA